MAKGPPSSALRKIPQVDLVLSQPWIEALEKKYSRAFLTAMARRAIEDLRKEILSGDADENDCGMEEIAARVSDLAGKRLGGSLKELINATGVIIHTNLGRSPLSQRVMERIERAALSYSNLEYDLGKGARGERNSHLTALMEELTGAESALAVNNNAAAVLLALSTLARGREVLVSRGELIEIGGSFRIPEVMAQSNALLREVGTTNRTHLKDYEQALNENTALLLKVHTSNYKIVGFTKEVSLKEMARLGASRGIPTMFDLGSGCLVDLSGFGLRGEPTVRQALESGVDLVSLSGDKLLGGPQAGILAGRGDLIERMRSNPLARALRMDKMTLAGLEATLQAYVTPEGPFKEIPTLAMLSKSEEELARDARELAGAIEQGLANELAVTLEEGEGRVGGGSLPIAALNAQRVKLRPKRIRAAELERRLRASEPPLIVLIQDDAVVLDTRTLLRDQKRMIPGILERAFAR